MRRLLFLGAMLALSGCSALVTSTVIGWFRDDDKPAAAAEEVHDVKSYCTEANAYELGHGGKHYVNDCPPDLAEAFRTAFARGWEQRRAEQHLAE